MRAHDCYDAVLVLPWACPDGSELGLYVLFEHRVFIFEPGQELLPDTSMLWMMSQLGGSRFISETNLGVAGIPTRLCEREALALSLSAISMEARGT